MRRLLSGDRWMDLKGNGYLLDLIFEGILKCLIYKEGLSFFGLLEGFVHFEGVYVPDHFGFCDRGYSS
jgi:hypothetical protein